MKTTDFRKPVNSSQLKENMNKMFGVNVNLTKYSREQLEDMRNKLRTRVFHQEGKAGINDLLTNETYQKDKAMLALLNTRIKEMLGEDIKKLRDKMTELSEAKKGVRAPKFTKKAAGTKDYDGDGKVEPAKDEVWGSRAKAAAKSGHPFSEAAKPDFLDKDKDGNKKEPMKKAVKDAKVKEDSTKITKTASGGTVTKTATGSIHKAGPKGYGNKWDGETQDQAPAKASKASKSSAEKKADKSKDIKLPAWKGNVTRHSSNHGADKDDGTGDEVKETSRQSATTMKHVKNPTAGEKAAAKDIKPGIAGYKDRIDMLKSAEKDGRLKSEGKDEGKPGKNFAKIAKSAGKHYGSKEAGERVAGAVRAKLAKQGKLEEANARFKHNVRFVNESLGFLLSEDEEGKAKAITSAGDIVNDYTSWMQRVGQYQTKTMIELADAIKADFGAAEAEAFKQAVGPALSATLEVLTSQREAVSNAVAALAGEATPDAAMGMEPEMPAEPGMDMSAPDEMNPMPAGDEFGASDAAAGAGTTGREMRESKFARKLAESHSILTKLAK
jgi:hypothetical protein